MKTILEICLEYRAAMPAPTAHANHVLLAIPNSRLQGLRVGDIATDVLKTVIDAWVIPFGPFVVGSGRAKDANAITLEYRSRVARRWVTIKSIGDSHFVQYVERQPRQRNCAAVFHKSMKTAEEVRAWVHANPKLSLQ